MHVPYDLLKSEDDDPMQIDDSNSGGANRVKIVLSQPTSATSAPPLVSNICSFMALIDGRKERCGLCLAKNKAVGKLFSTEKVVVPFYQADKVAFRTFLAPHASSRFPIRSGMILALRLASSFLQLSRTKWLRTTWSINTIYFLRQSQAISDNRGVDFTRPFVSLPFNGSPDTADPSQVPLVELKQTLLDLGVLLLEIWHSQTLEEHFRLQHVPTEYYGRLRLAS